MTWQRQLITFTFYWKWELNLSRNVHCLVRLHFFCLIVAVILCHTHNYILLFLQTALQYFSNKNLYCFSKLLPYSKIDLHNDKSNEIKYFYLSSTLYIASDMALENPSFSATWPQCNVAIDLTFLNANKILVTNHYHAKFYDGACASESNVECIKAIPISSLRELEIHNRRPI